MRIDFHPDAEREIQEQTDWYAERSVKAALGFRTALDLAIAKIEADPGRFPTVSHGQFACSLGRYPFQVIFRHQGRDIQIIAVAHAKRQAGFWNDRLGK